MTKCQHDFSIPSWEIDGGPPISIVDYCSKCGLPNYEYNHEAKKWLPVNREGDEMQESKTIRLRLNSFKLVRLLFKADPYDEPTFHNVCYWEEEEKYPLEIPLPVEGCHCLVCERERKERNETITLDDNL